MHRATPFATSFRAYSSGGARSVVDKADDKPQMQEMSGNFLKGETRSEIESPQNYGFTSVVMPAKKGKDGQIEESAEAFISFIGGNRSFPVATIMDDRRYRLKELEAGDVAIFDHLEHQIHLNKDGVFITGRTDKKLKFQLAEPPQQQQSGGEQKKTGQKKRYDKTSGKYLDINPGGTELVHDSKIDYKTGTHTFHPPAAGLRAGGPLVKILGDKFTDGFGEFTKQVKALDPAIPEHLATKRYVDAMVGLATGGGGGGAPPGNMPPVTPAVNSGVPPLSVSGYTMSLLYDSSLSLVAGKLHSNTFWNDVQSKPATFPPGAHTHPISDVTGLQTKLNALDAKDTALTAKDDEIIATKVSKGGDTMTGRLTLSEDPSSPLHAVTKQYCDLRLLDAPSDNVVYGRQNGAWVAAAAASDVARALADRIRITDEGVFIDGDVFVTGDLVVEGVVRARGFETMP